MSNELPIQVAIPPQPPGVPAAKRSLDNRFGGLLASLDLALPIGLLAVAFLVAAFAVRNSDFWQHLATGRLLVEGAYSFGVDPFSSNGTDRYWVNHAWLYDLVVYTVFNLGGGFLLIVLKGLAVAFLIGLLYYQKPADQPSWVWAAVAALALLAMAPRLFLQPALVSFVLAGMLAALLVNLPARVGSWRLPIAVGVICAIWVNCDQWFFLGPLFVVLYLIGEVVQSRVAPNDRTGSLKMLGITAVIAIAATLVNPHHIHAWTLPIELTSSQFANDVEGERMFRSLLVTPFDPQFYRNTGNPLNPAAYFVLLLLSAVGIGLNYAKARWGQVVLWVGVTALSLLHARAVPFFAVVAAPLVASIWCQLGVELMTKSRVAREAAPSFALSARLLTSLLGLLMLFAAWPGWLNANATLPAYARRVSFELDPEQSMARLGSQLTQWREDGRLPADARGFHSHPDIGNYLSWYAPTEKTAFDGRFSFHAPDVAEFAEMREALRDLSKSGDAQARRVLRRLMAERRLSYVVLFANPNLFTDLADIGIAARLLWDDPDWTLWYMDGRTMVFGFKPAKKGESLSFDPVSLAFTNDDPVPPPSNVLPPADPGFVRRYLIAPPAVPLEADEARMLIEYTGFRVEMDQQELMNHRRLSFLIAGQAPIFAPPGPQQGEMVALPILAVRAARKAVAISPDAPGSYFALAEAYARMTTVPDIQRLQVVTALSRCITRSPKPEQATSALSFEPIRASRRLAEVRVQMGQYDLALKDLRREMAYLEKCPPIPPLDPKEVSERLKFLQDQVRWGGLPPDELVSRLSDDYENAAQRQPSIGTRVAIARRMGLVGEAIEVYQKAVADDRLAEEFGPQQLGAALDLISLEMQAGQIEQAMHDFEQLLEKDGTVAIENLSENEPGTREAFRDRWILGLWLSGDFERAGQEMDILIRSGPLHQSPESLNRLTKQSLVGLADHWPTSELLAIQSLSAMFQLLQSEGDQHVRRGLISIEAGNNKNARAHFEEALKPRGVSVPFPSRAIAEEYLRIMPPTK